MAKNKSLRLLYIYMAVLMVFSACFAVVANAAPDLTKKGSISLTLIDPKTGEPLPNKTFRLYFVANSHIYGNSIYYTYTKDFENNGMPLSDRYATYLPEHLSYYAERFSLPYTEKKTDQAGVANFSNLKTGLYLVVPEDGVASPFLVGIPEKIGNKWYYDVDASPKVSGESDHKERFDISVQKKWKNDKHPNTAVVVLVRDGKEYSTVVLSINNDWKHTWQNLSPDHAWFVVEKEVHAGYNVEYEIIGDKVVIINYKPSEENTTKPDDTTKPDKPWWPDWPWWPDKPDPDTTTKPSDTTSPDDTTDVPTGTTSPNGENDNPTKPTKPAKPGGDKEETTKEELADTGQLNWPVPVFAGLGLLLFGIGWGLTNIKKKEKYTAS